MELETTGVPDMIKSLKRVLVADLTKEIATCARRSDLFTHYLGGTGVASKLLLEECPPNVDPFSPAAPIILATGPLVGLLPSMTKAVAMFKSPLTGNLGESHAGGYLATTLRSVDYGAIVIKGRSEKPISLIVDDEGIRFEDASSLWNRSPNDVDNLLRQRTSIKARYSIMSIGRAGETRVSYASAVVDRYHHFGRLGLGAVMGSKNLKAVVINTDNVTMTDRSGLESVREEAKGLVCNTDTMKKYGDLGTAANILELNALGSLPSRNFSRPRYDEADAVSGETFAQLLERKTSCPNCPVPCIHLGLGTDTENQPTLVTYNYEPIFALGTNLDVSEPKGVLRLIGKCGNLGMDAIMTGAVLAWATEAYERGLLSQDQMMGLRPEWGDVATYIDMIDDIVDGRNPFYVAMARGVYQVAEEYGGKDFAVSLGKNSPAGYATGYGHLVGTLIGARHSHLSNAGYRVDQIALSSNMNHREIMNLLIQEEDWLNVLNSLVACYFARDAYSKKFIVTSLSAIGINYSEKALMALGREISCNLYNFKRREGFDLTKEKIPRRLLEIKGPTGDLDPNIIQRMISQYIQLMQNTISGKSVADRSS